MEEMEQERQRQALRQQIIEEERQKLLQEHAQTLLGFMPKVRAKFSFAPSSFSKFMGLGTIRLTLSAEGQCVNE